VVRGRREEGQRHCHDQSGSTSPGWYVNGLLRRVVAPTLHPLFFSPPSMCCLDCCYLRFFGFVFEELLYTGQGCAVDRDAGVRLLKSAVEKGEPGAMLTLADIYEDGKYGVAQNFAEAATLYSLAIEKGQPMAMNSLAGEGLSPRVLPSLPSA
jgi:hypothetical protein